MTYQESGLRALQDSILGCKRVDLNAALSTNSPMPAGTPMYQSVRAANWPDYGMLRIYQQVMNSAQPSYRI